MTQRLIKFFVSTVLNLSALASITIGLVSCESIPFFGHSKEEQLQQAIQGKKIREEFKKQELIDDKTAIGLLPPFEQKVMMPYYIQRGDTLSEVAEKIYGSSKKWSHLAQINKIENPDQIFAGEVISYELNDETKYFSEAYENAPTGKITIKPGDNLAKISRMIYGTQQNWRILWKQNPEIFNPSHIQVGDQVSFRSQIIATGRSLIPLNIAMTRQPSPVQTGNWFWMPGALVKKKSLM